MKPTLACIAVLAGLANAALAAQPDPDSVAQMPAMPAERLVLKPGGSLDGLLGEAGFDAQQRMEIAKGLAAEQDPARLPPGQILDIIRGGDGEVTRLSLLMENRDRIEIDPAKPDQPVRIEPETETVAEAGELTVVGSVYATLKSEELPAHFATDLAQVFGMAFDFSRDVQGGETVQLIWQQEVDEEGAKIGNAELSYAAVDTGSRVLEAVWPGPDADNLTIFRDGEALRVYTPPVTGARISSGFGVRVHPVHGSRRMHNGVDFAAPTGTPVNASASGTVTFAGRHGGYGIMVEIAHGGGMTTRYAHLSALGNGIRKGSKVDTSTLIGKVGSTGLSTGPHLHYEVRFGGKPADPMSDSRLANPDAGDTGQSENALRSRRAQYREMTGTAAAGANKTAAAAPAAPEPKS